MKKVLILSGEKSSGKTTLLFDYCYNRKNISGILTPLIEKRRQLYVIDKKLFLPMEESEGENLKVGRYIFSKSSFEKSELQLFSSQRGEIELTMIDEIGLLELRKEGFYSIINRLINSNDRSKLLFVVRMTKLSEILETFNIKPAKIIYTPMSAIDLDTQIKSI